MVASLGRARPRVSKHLRVLREVGLVGVRGSGQQRMYKLILPEHRDGLRQGWEYWLDRIRERAERKNRG
jgi:DNA-binding transcriptional ArsR family regulator